MWIASRAFRIGALMTLKTGGPVNFKPRPIEGASEGVKPSRRKRSCWTASNA